MTRYAERAEIQRAVNLAGTGMTNMDVARELGRAYATVNGWLRPGGLAGRLGLVAGVEIVKEEVPPEKIRVRVPANTQHGNSAIRVLAIGDAHDSPKLEDKSRFYAMGKLAKERGITHVVQIGDFADFDSVSTHIAADSIEGKLNNPYTADIVSLNRAMEEFDRGANGATLQRFCTHGNHERRIYLYENSHPQIEGMLTSELEQTFKDHGWSFAPYGEYYFLAGVGFVHAALNRLGKTIGGKTAENTIANEAVFDHIIGHSHVRREHRAPKLGPSKHVTVLNLGCALPQGYVEPYLYHGQLSGWWWGINIVTIQGGQIAGVEAIHMSALERLND